MYIGLPHTMDKHTFPFNPFSLKSIASQIVGHSLHFLLSSSFLLYIIPHPRSSSSRIPSPKGYSASILQPPQSPHIFVSNNFLPSLPLSFYHSHPSLFPLPFSSPLLVYVFVTCDQNISRDDICALTPKTSISEIHVFTTNVPMSLFPRSKWLLPSVHPHLPSFNIIRWVWMSICGTAYSPRIPNSLHLFQAVSFVSMYCCISAG